MVELVATVPSSGDETCLFEYIEVLGDRLTRRVDAMLAGQPLTDFEQRLSVLAAREELDQIETGLMFAARAAGMTWSELAEALSLQSRQAAQQRFDRVRTRLDEGPST